MHITHFQNIAFYYSRLFHLRNVNNAHNDVTEAAKLRTFETKMNFQSWNVYFDFHTSFSKQEMRLEIGWRLAGD